MSFDPKESMWPEYRAQLTPNGWPNGLDVVPTFIGRGGRAAAPAFSAREAVAAALAIDALVVSCERHEDAIVDEAFPITDTVELVGVGVAGRTGTTTTVRASMPPHARRSG